MTIREYQKEAHAFADYPQGYMATNGYPPFRSGERSGGVMLLPWIYPVIGLAEETGEFCGKIAKAFRDENGEISEERKMLAAKELGDIMWFVAENATLLGLDLEMIMAGNIAKLTDRRKRNKIHGDGDLR